MLEHLCCLKTCVTFHHMALHILRQLVLYALQKSHKKVSRGFFLWFFRCFLFSHTIGPWCSSMTDLACFTNRHSGWKKIVFTWWLSIVPAGRFFLEEKGFNFLTSETWCLDSENVVIMKVIMILIMMMTTTMMIFHLWNDAVILKLLLQQSIFLLQCFHLTIVIIIIMMRIMILMMRIMILRMRIMMI